MLTGQSIIYFAPGKWKGLWRNRQQLMSIFARCNRVLFVERRPYLRPTLADWQRGRLTLADLQQPLVRKVADNLFVFHYPYWVPVSGRFPLKQLIRAARQFLLQRALNQLDMSQPIVWFSQPDMLELVSEMPPARLLLYHVVDEYSAYSDQTPTTRRLIQTQEQQMLAHVDAVVVVSKNLYEAKRPFNTHTYLVPNGVNYQAYTAALADPYLPDALQTIQPPRLGYSGLIGDRLNLSMLDKLAQENPEWSLVFLGEVTVSQQAEVWQRLLLKPNVHYLGLVEIAQVPHYLKGLQVGLIPYMQSREAENISPLKLYDYLAVGLPVASMNIPAAREFSPYIHLASSPPDFGHAVRAALADTRPERYQDRRKVAAQHSWEARVEQLSELIQDQLVANFQ